jgi:hypothetical protein
MCYRQSHSNGGLNTCFHGFLVEKCSAVVQNCLELLQVIGLNKNQPRRLVFYSHFEVVALN